MVTNISRRDLMLFGASGAALALGAPRIGRAQSKTRLKMQALWPSGPNYQAFERFAKRVGEMSGGRLEIETLPVGAVVPPGESIDAVAAGVLDGHYNAPSYASGREPGLGLLGDLNGGFDDPYHVQMWMDFGGGLELLREVYRPWGVHVVGSVQYGVESLSSRKPIRRIEDFKGLKIRAPEGVNGLIMRALGAAVVTMAGSEVFTALQTNVIDAADWTTLADNYSMGFYKVCKFATYPGFHSAGNLDVSVNLRRWNALSPDLQSILTVAVRDFTRDSIQSNEIANRETAIKLKSEGVELTNWTPAERNRYRSASREQWHVWAQKSPMAKKILASQESFLKTLGVL